MPVVSVDGEVTARIVGLNVMVGDRRVGRLVKVERRGEVWWRAVGEGGAHRTADCPSPQSAVKILLRKSTGLS